MLREFFLHKKLRTRAFAWAGVVVLLAHAGLNAYLSLLFNQWYEKFYNQAGSASESGSGAFEDEEGQRKIAWLLVQFGLLCLPYVIVHPAFRWLTNVWTLRWRLVLIKSYLLRWPIDGSAPEGASQRVHEDTARLAKGINALAVTFLSSVLTIITFSPLLIEIGGQVQPSTMPRWWLFATCMSTAAAGSMVSLKLGFPLINLEIANQRVEASLRKRLVFLEDCPINSLGDDEFILTPAPHFRVVLLDLRENYRVLYRRFFFFGAWLGAFEQAVSIMPYAITAPLLFASSPERRITMGLVVKTSNAFSKIFSAFNVISDSFTAITELASVVVRLREFERAAGQPDRAARSTQTIYEATELVTATAL